MSPLFNEARVADVERLSSALHPPSSPPAGPAWNLAELEGVLASDCTLTRAAVLVPLMERDDGFHVLLTLRNDGLRHHAGQVSFPGGRIEPDDDGPAAAALREAQEEIGLPTGAVAPLGWLDPLATATGFRVLPLVAHVQGAFQPIPDPAEVAEVFEVPLAYLLEPQNLQRVRFNYRGSDRWVLEYLPHAGGARIWGATASMLQNLIDRLAAAGR